MNQNDENLFSTRLRRRQFVSGGLLLMSPRILSRESDPVSPSAIRSRMGLITDLHYADKPPAGTRFYRESVAKLREARTVFRDAGVSHVVELGDLIDAADSVALEQEYLGTIHNELRQLPGEKHYVLGNHCVDTLTKEEFLAGVGAQRAYESFDHSGFHFVILDACFREDGVPYQRRNFEWTDPNIPKQEFDWLRNDLAATRLPVVVFVHQRLDVGAPYGIKNAPAIRRLLEESESVVAVFQGHSHKNDYRLIGGVHYVTLVAMVEGSGEDRNGYSILNLHDEGVLSLSGSREQKSYQWG